MESRNVPTVIVQQGKRSSITLILLIALLIAVVAGVYYTTDSYYKSMINSIELTKQHSIDSIENINDSILSLYKTKVVNLKLSVQQYNKKLDSLDSVIMYKQLDNDSAILRLKKNNISEDSAYFALKSGSKIIITPNNNVTLSHKQLKFANINILENELKTDLLMSKDKTISILKNRGIVLETMVETQDKMILTLNNQLHLKSKEIELNKSMCKLKVTDEKRKGNKKFLVGGGLGIALVILAQVLIR